MPRYPRCVSLEAIYIYAHEEEREKIKTLSRLGPGSLPQPLLHPAHNEYSRHIALLFVVRCSRFQFTGAYLGTTDSAAYLYTDLFFSNLFHFRRSAAYSFVMVLSLICMAVTVDTTYTVDNTDPGS